MKKNDRLKEEVPVYFTTTINEFQSRLKTFRTIYLQRASLSELRSSFSGVRQAYKKLAILSEYFYPYESVLLNAPAIQRVEEDNPDLIIEPHGLQVIEQFLFQPPFKRNNSILKEINLINSTLSKLKSADKTGQFREELVWDAIRRGISRVMTTGITGFDSPVAKNSIVEAKASLAAINEIYGLLTKHKTRDEKDKAFSDTIFKAIQFLSSARDFDKIDRLEFITNYLDPLYRILINLRTKHNIPVPQGSSPVNYNATSIFEPNALNIDFYSPNQDYTLTEKRIALGKKLFFDPILSVTKDRSCASCHQPALAFTDGLKVPLAINKITILTRNTPTLLNAGFQTRQFFDSRADLLENQLDEVVHNPSEMGGSLKNLTADLINSKEYSALFKEAYATEITPIRPFTIGNAISSYVRSLASLNSRFDLYMRGDHSKLTAIEKNGFNLFAGKGKCATCHFIPVFNGLLAPEFTKTESEVIGVPATNTKDHAVLDPDEGKFRFTSSPVDKFSFKTPTLRNIELTAPYMHNGVFNTLEEVVDFYNKGGGKGLHIAPPNQTLPFDKLNLTEKEQKDIIAFLKALTDTSDNQIGHLIKK